MKAALVTPKKAGSLRVGERPDPRPGPAQVLVRTLQVGLCGTDAEIAEGLYGEAPPGERDLVLGHENFGVVEEVGKRVTGFRPGDLVVATVRRPCPERCAMCRKGRQDFCLTGDYRERGIRGLDGFLAERYVEDASYLHKVDRRVASYGALAEPTSVVDKAIDQTLLAQDRLPWKPKVALVTGAGPIGLLAAMVCRLRGLDVWVYSKGAATGPRRRILDGIGASYLDAQQVAPGELDARIGQIDLVLEATGYSPLIFDLVQQAGRNAAVCLTGITGGHRSDTIDANQIDMTLVLMNKMVLGSVNAGPPAWARACAHLREFRRRWGDLAELLITRRIPLDEVAAGMRKRPEDIKVVVEVSAP